MNSVSETVIGELTKIQPIVFVGSLSYSTSEPEDGNEVTRLSELAVQGLTDLIKDQGYEPVFLGVMEIALRFVHWVCREAGGPGKSWLDKPDEYSVETLFDAVIESEFLGNLCRYCTLVTRERLGSPEEAEKVFDEVRSKLSKALESSRVKIAARVLFALIVVLAQTVFRESLVRAVVHTRRYSQDLITALLSELNEDLAESDNRTGTVRFMKPTKGEG
jgi:hypothetical protein